MRVLQVLILLLAAVLPERIESFSPQIKRRARSFISSSTALCDSSSPIIIDHSTIAHLGQVGLKRNKPDYLLDFHLFLLGCGQVSGTPWHFACGDEQQFAIQIDAASSINGSQEKDNSGGASSSIGLRFASLDGLKKRLAATTEDPDTCCVQSFDVTDDHVRIVDRYGTVYYCREEEESSDDTSCLGISYVELDCPIGNAAKIAQFYDSVFDATTTVMKDEGVALVGIGPVQESGKAKQYLIFRESEDVSSKSSLSVTLHVGQNAADFKQCYKNCNIAGLLDDNDKNNKPLDNEFQFQNIIDIETGDLLFTLEHKIRSVEHDAFPTTTTTE